MRYAFMCFLFNVFYFSWTLFVSMVGIPFYFMPTWKFSSNLAIIWAKGTFRVMKRMIGLSYRLEGFDKLPPGSCIIACKHQSAFETIGFHTFVRHPSYVLKRELLWIPFFGWHLMKSGCVAIDRSSGTKAMKKMLKGAQRVKNQGRPLVIFPEGTRVRPDEKKPFNPGIAFLYDQLKVPVVPVVLNSGLFWGKRAFMKRPGTITLRMLDPIPPGLDKRTFLKTLEGMMETAYQKLLEDTKGDLK